MRLRSWIARAKSDVRVERRSMSLREVMSKVDLADDREGLRAVTMGLSLNSRLVPFVEEDRGDSHCVWTACSMAETRRKRFSPVTGSTPSNLALPPPTKKARMPTDTLCIT